MTIDSATDSVNYASDTDHPSVLVADPMQRIRAYVDAYPLRFTEVAEVLGVSGPSLRIAAARGQLHAVKINGTWRTNAEAVARYAGIAE